MDEMIERLMSVHGGVCPDCATLLQVVEIAGCQDFLDECSIEGKELVMAEKPWEVRDFMTERGVIVYECLVCNKHYETYAVVGGDWTLAEEQIPS